MNGFIVKVKNWPSEYSYWHAAARNSPYIVPTSVETGEPESGNMFPIQAWQYINKIVGNRLLTIIPIKQDGSPVDRTLWREGVGYIENGKSYTYDWDKSTLTENSSIPLLIAIGIGIIALVLVSRKKHG